MFMVKNSTEISLLCLIPLWQPSLKYNQLFRVICCQRAEDLTHSYLRLCYVSQKPVSRSVSPTNTMWHVVWNWPWENVHSYQRCTVDLRGAALCQRGRLSTHQVPSICLTGPHGKWQPDPQPVWVSSTMWLRVLDRSICTGRRLAVSMWLIVFAERKKNLRCRSAQITETGNSQSHTDTER